MSANPARIQANSGINTAFASSVTVTLTNVKMGNALIIAAEYDAGAANSGNAPTDTVGNKYFLLGSVNLAATFELEIWITINKADIASNVITCTDNNLGVDSIACAEEWSGITGGVLALNSSSGSSGISANLDSGSFSTVAPGIIWVAGLSAVGTSTMVLGSGYSNLTQNNTTFSNLGIESQINNGGGNFSGTFTNTPASWACLGIALFASNLKFPNKNLRPRMFAPGNAR